MGGQLNEILGHHREKMEINNIKLVKEKLDNIRERCGGYYSISSREISDNYRIAYDIQQVIRYRLAWDENPDGGFGFIYDKPIKYSNVELPVIEEISHECNNL